MRETRTGFGAKNAQKGGNFKSEGGLQPDDDEDDEDLGEDDEDEDGEDVEGDAVDDDDEEASDHDF